MVYTVDGPKKAKERRTHDAAQIRDIRLKHAKVP